MWVKNGEEQGEFALWTVFTAYLIQPRTTAML